MYFLDHASFACFRFSSGLVSVKVLSYNSNEQSIVLPMNPDDLLCLCALQLTIPIETSDISNTPPSIR